MSIALELPRTDEIRLFDPPTEGVRVEFRLVYRGKLPAQSSGGGGSRLKEKHLLRKEFHRQLRELWKQHPNLRAQSEELFAVMLTPHNQVNWPGPNVRQIVPVLKEHPGAKTWVEHIADSWPRCGGRFVPLISKQGGFTCSLNILFLRRDNPGNLIASGGDIDNRIKVLLDGLQMPKNTADMAGFLFDASEDPFYCLLEDDSLITNISVTTDRLLTPQQEDENVHDVQLIIHAIVVNPSAIFTGNRLI